MFKIDRLRFILRYLTQVAQWREILTSYKAGRRASHLPRTAGLSANGCRRYSRLAIVQPRDVHHQSSSRQSLSF